MIELILAAGIAIASVTVAFQMARTELQTRRRQQQRRDEFKRFR